MLIHFIIIMRTIMRFGSRNAPICCERNLKSHSDRLPHNYTVCTYEILANLQMFVWVFLRFFGQKDRSGWGLEGKEHGKKDTQGLL